MAPCPIHVFAPRERAMNSPRRIPHRTPAAGTADAPCLSAEAPLPGRASSDRVVCGATRTAALSARLRRAAPLPHPAADTTASLDAQRAAPTERRDRCLHVRDADLRVRVRDRALRRRCFRLAAFARIDLRA